MESHEHVMTVYRNRQVSVVDLGDRVVMRPISEDPVGSLKGKYAGRGPSGDTGRATERRAARGRDRS
jgi:hypothetical protein